MKINLLRVLSGFSAITKTNENSDRLEEAFQNTLSRDGTSPNEMQANLDMADHRIINLAAPQNPNDAVRLQDVLDLEGGEFEVIVSSDWDDITGKPSTFPPSAHTHVASEVTDLDEKIQDVIGTKVVGGSSINIAYNDATGDTTVSMNNHSHAIADLTGLQEYVEDLIGSSLLGGTNVTISYDDGTGKTTVNSTGGGGGGSGFPIFEDFGGVGDGVTDNAGAFATAQAGTELRIYLGDNVYKTTGSPNSIQYDRFYGPGKILFGTSYRPASYHNILTKPTSGTGVDLDFYYSGDISRVNVEHWKWGSASSHLRRGITERYFDSVTTPYFGVMQSFMGYSGTTARTTNTITTGATTVNLDLSASGGSDLPAGREFIFSPDQDGVGGTLHTATVVSVVGSTLTFTPAVPAATTINSGYYVLVGKRTMQSFEHKEVTHKGAGDHYIWLGRIVNEYQPTAGQTHFFNTATIGMIGGDLVNVFDGVYSTGTEILIDGGSTDSAGIGHVLSMNRNNDNAARGEIWAGLFMQSFGSKPVNAGVHMHGKFNVGLSLGLSTADYGPNKGAIGMKIGDRIHFDMQNRTGTQGIQLVADIYPAQPLYIGSVSESGVKMVEAYAGGYRWRLQDNGGFTTNAAFTASGNITSGGNVTAIGGSVYIGSGDTRLYNDGSAVYLIRNSVIKETWV